MKNPTIEREQLYCAHNYSPLPVVLVRGQGVYVWDDTGKRYIDMMSAYSAVNHGHCHPKLLQALQQQASTLNIVSRAFYTDKLGYFLERICKLTGFDKALPMNTGVEAVETGIKAARKWAYLVKGIPQNQAEIIVCHGNFHGRTITAISMSSVAQYKDKFGPYTPGFRVIPYNDARLLEEAITPHTAAFLVEPIQGEGGINVPSKGYLKACEEICRKHQVLMICDEIQTGLGRTGRLLACEHEDVQPDGMLLGKALGGGLLPVSLFLSRREVMDVFTPGDHGSTFGGNPLAAAVGAAAIDVLYEENLISAAAKMGEYFQQQLRSIQSPMIKEVRGKGLLIGLELDKKYSAHAICLKLLEHGILTKETQHTVIRFAPPLMITKEQIDETVAALQDVLR
ncbi:MAG: ornithine--oxo-acid transaminase [Gammaproteobacteria bacterium RIFCSPHIGHO2_12_FULL_37_14]|nr:MAG: ornithine--oxo-acid transaminase [Gammaproteobacteria bacterium RIFCSPHIGHO2_12_FULL_37_14]